MLHSSLSQTSNSPLHRYLTTSPSYSTNPNAPQPFHPLTSLQPGLTPPPPPSPIRTPPLLHPLSTPTTSSSFPSPYTPTSSPYKNPTLPDPLDFSPLPDPRLTKNSGGESGGRLATNFDMN
ncbi:hypothetical protein Pmani_017315 [Petrolisthes manimaculis]|uniref:Uncharacterized protein n=1 Tax=Petrolisthes manimaculis TaxID=1843537 RepID=A0AAE1PMP6_9EUCA|nr:hypothetical protein Pmani_017315 [Petrolisthes manimaculis]